MLIDSSPWLFAVNRVLLRLLMPRHSPYALCSLNFSVLSLCVILAISDFGCFHHPSVAKLQFLTFFLERPISFLLLSLSVRLLYSVFNDHLPASPFVGLALWDFASESLLLSGSCKPLWSVWMDSNQRPRAYQARALTT